MFKRIRNISIMVIAIALILVVAVVPGDLKFFQTTPAKYETLDVKNFEQGFRTNPNAVLLDVRTPEEIAESKIDSPVQIDYDGKDFHQQLDKLDKNKEYYIYCRSGRRSGEACEYLSEKGYKCYNLKGGIDAWNAEKK